MIRTQGRLYVLYDPDSEKVWMSFFITLKDLAESIRFRDAFRGIETVFSEVARERDLRMDSYGILDPHDLPSELEGLDLRDVPRADIEDFVDMKTMDTRTHAVERLKHSLLKQKRYIRPRLTVGSIARDVNFYDRENAIEDVTEALKSGHVLLVAPRRFGKSSLLYALFDNPLEPWKPVLIDVERATTPVQFVARIIATLRTMPWLSEFPQTLGRIGGPLINASYQQIQNAEARIAKHHAHDWAEYFAAVFSSVKADGIPLLLLIDEFPWVLEELIGRKERTEAKRLIDALNSVAVAEAPYRILMAGSANMDSLLHQLGGDFVKSFRKAFSPVKLPPMTIPAARELVRIILADNDLYPDEEALEAILDCIGKTMPIPFFLQLLASRIVNAQRPIGAEPTAEDVREIYERDLLGPDSKRFFEPYSSAINRYSDELQLPARKVLAHLTVSSATESDLGAIIRIIYTGASAEDVKRLLGYLENDLYIVRDEYGKFEFSSKVLRDWWRRQGRLGW